MQPQVIKNIGKPCARIALWLLYNEAGKVGVIAKAVKCHNKAYFDELIEKNLVAPEISSRTLRTLWREQRINLTMRGRIMTEIAVNLVKIMGVDTHKDTEIIFNEGVINIVRGCIILLSGRTLQELSELLKLVRNVNSTTSQFENPKTANSISSYKTLRPELTHRIRYGETVET